MNFDYSYCLNEDTCLHRVGCKRWVGNYEEKYVKQLADEYISYVDDKDCIKNDFSILDRFRLSSGEKYDDKVEIVPKDKKEK